MKWRAYATVKSAFKSGSRLCQSTLTVRGRRTGRLCCHYDRGQWTFHQYYNRKVEKRCPSQKYRDSSEKKSFKTLQPVFAKENHTY